MIVGGRALSFAAIMLVGGTEVVCFMRRMPVTAACSSRA